MPVADQAPAPLIVGEAGVGGEERLHLGLDGLRQHAPGPFPQHHEQRIIRDRRAWLRQRDNGTFLHGVSFLVT